MSIEVKGLTKLYGTQRAVDGITFSAQPGEIVGFLGPNGAGKSTTMKMLTGYLSPTEGEARVAGFDIVEESLAVRRAIGYLPEHNPLYLEMYVREYLRFIARLDGYTGNAKARIAELVDLTGLGKEQHKRIGQLSKGYRQRVGLAQALLHDPQVLILDEPTSGLDPNQIVEIRRVITESGIRKTVLLSTHIMQEVQAMCTRVIIIANGRIVGDGGVEELTAQTAGRQTLRVVFKRQPDEKMLRALEGVHEVKKQGEAWHITSGKGADLRDGLFAWAAAQNNPIHELQPMKESLEEVFRTLTQQKIQPKAEA